MTPDPIIITGARGRVGNVLANHFTRTGHEVIRVSRTGGRGFLALEDLFRSGLLRAAGTLIHCAWSTVPKTAEENPGAAWKDDLPLLARLLGSIASASSANRPALFFFSTGGAVYGEGQPNQPKVETDALHPVGWYGTGKVAAEELIGAFQQLAGLEATILRVSNLYGFSYDPAKPQGFIAAALHAGQTGKPLQIWGDGTMTKDYLHLTDLCQAVERSVTVGIRGTYNLCTGISHSVAEILKIVESAIGTNISVEYARGPAWDVHCSVLSPNKFSSTSGWRASTTVADGIKLKNLEI